MPRKTIHLFRLPVSFSTCSIWTMISRFASQMLSRVINFDAHAVPHRNQQINMCSIALPFRRPQPTSSANSNRHLNCAFHYFFRVQSIASRNTHGTDIEYMKMMNSIFSPSSPPFQLQLWWLLSTRCVHMKHSHALELKQEHCGDGQRNGSDQIFFERNWNCRLAEICRWEIERSRWCSMLCADVYLITWYDSLRYDVLMYSELQSNTIPTEQIEYLLFISRMRPHCTVYTVYSVYRPHTHATFCLSVQDSIRSISPLFLVSTSTATLLPSVECRYRFFNRAVAYSTIHGVNQMNIETLRIHVRILFASEIDFDLPLEFTFHSTIHSEFHSIVSFHTK